MATAGSLRRRIRELEIQLDSLREQQDETRRRIETDHARRTAELKAELKRELAQNRAQMQHEFDSRAQAIREELFAQMQRQAEELRAFDAQAQRERQQMLEDLKRTNDELAAELDQMRRQEQQRTEESRGLAEGLASEAQAQRAAVEALPHGFFCAGQLDVFAEHLGQVQTFLSQGMCEAAASSADICLAELQILEINVRALQREWEDLFWEYRGQATMLHQLMEEFEQGPVESPMGRFVLVDEDRDYWSGGQYGAIHDDVEEAYQLVRGVEEAGDVGTFLRSGAAPRGRQMVRAITGLQRLSDRLLAAITCIRNEMGLSDGREMLADQAEEILAPLGFHRVSGGFRGDEPLDSYVLELTINGIDTLRLTFMPVREDGVAVRNRCLMSFDIRTTPSSEFAKKLAQDVAEKLEEGFRGALKIEWYGSDADKLKAIEDQSKAAPDMRLLVRRIERKHQQ